MSRNPDNMLSYGAGPLIRLLAVTGAVALMIRRTAVR